MGLKAINEHGKKHGRLTVLSFAGTNTGKKRTWKCRCDCGKVIVAIGQNVRNGNTNSCGCYQIDRARAAAWKHGHNRVGRKTIQYVMWQHAKKRAKIIGVPFDILVTDLPAIPSVCPVFGIPIAKGTGKRSASSPSLDRIINRLGYVKGNLRIISWRANSLKSNATLQELRLLLKDAERCSIGTETSGQS
jgi:hypothetical protein